MSADFWRGKRVFLTGHTGFKGGWLSLCLQQAGAVVVGYALQPPTQPSLFEVAEVGAGMQSVTGDIRDGEALSSALTAAQPEIVFHLAAQALVAASYADPVETYATNVMGTVHLLEAVRRSPAVRVVINVTSDKCYENREWDWPYREADPLGGRDPYSSSKACAELVHAAYARSFFAVAPGRGAPPALASVRAGNVIGGGDWAADRLVPDAMRAFPAGRTLEVRSPAAIRPWQHVLEPLHGYMALAEQLWRRPELSGPWNFGPAEQDSASVAELLDALAACWSGAAAWRSVRAPGFAEAGQLRLDSSKARRQLGWRPAWSLAQALDAVVAWHKAHQAGAAMRAFSLQQIQAYQAVSSTPHPAAAHASA